MSHASPRNVLGLLVCIICCVLSAVSLAWGTTYFVSPGGHGDTPQGSCGPATNLATPINSVQAGYGCLSAGDTLAMRSGTYTEWFLLRKAGTAGAPITLTTYAPDLPSQAIITATDGIICPGGGCDGSILELILFGPQDPQNPMYHVLSWFTIDGSQITAGGRGCISIYNANVTMDHMTLNQCTGQGIQLSGDNFILRNSTIYGCGRIQTSDTNDTKGYALYAVGNNTLAENNLVDGCRGGGFTNNYHQETVTGPTRPTNVGNIYRNNIIRNGGCASPWGCIDPNWDGGTRPTVGRGFNFFDAFSPASADVYNNLIYNIHGTQNLGMCLDIGGANGNFVNNTCYDVDSQVHDLCAEPNSMTIQNNIFAQVVDPRDRIYCSVNTAMDNFNLNNQPVSATFVNAPGGDFTLKTGSQAIDTGVTQAFVTTDILGVARPQNGVYDLGAYEYNTVPLTPARLGITSQPQSVLAGVTLPTIQVDVESATGTIVTASSSTVSAVLVTTAFSLRTARVLVSVDSEETPSWSGAMALDGDPGTFWETPFLTSPSPAPPHTLIVDAGASYDFNGFQYLSRQDGQYFGNIASYAFYVSTDGSTWGTAVAQGTFLNNAIIKTVSFPVKTGRYVKLVALSTVNGDPYTNVAELYLLYHPGADGVLTGTSPVASSSGLANFTDFSITPGQLYMLRFTSPGLESVTSTPFMITTPPALSMAPPSELRAITR